MKLILLITVLLLSCTVHSLPIQTISYNYTPEAADVQALMDWEEELGQNLFVIVDKNADIRVYEKQRIRRTPANKNKVLGNAQIYVHKINKNYMYCRINITKNEIRREVMVHEIGHCFELHHTNIDNINRRSIMNRLVYKNSKIKSRHSRRVRRILIQRERNAN